MKYLELKMFLALDAEFEKAAFGRQFLNEFRQNVEM